jgi:predicted nucleic acid-binding Zn ribbon protein
LAAFRSGVFFSDYNPALMVERRARGWEPLGAVGARSLGLSSSRARELEVEAAWRRVAGPSLARRATVVSLRRGVLELAVAGPVWRRALERLLPELGARLAREHPTVGVTRFRLVDAPPA